MKLPCLLPFCQKLKANIQKRLLLSFSSAPQLLCSLALLFFCLPAFSQQRWERTYGGTGDDEGRSVQQTQDGGYIVAGWTTSFGDSFQVYLIKTDSLGDTLWTKTYGGASNDYGNSVQQTQDGGYIIAGYSFSFGNAIQVYLIKTNSQGDTLWTRTYGGPEDDRGYSVQQTSDGGYIIAGTYDYFGSNPQVYLIKTDASGDTLWSRTFGGSYGEEGYSVRQTLDGGYIIAGYTNSWVGYGTEVYVIRTDTSGVSLWARPYGGFSNDWGESVQQTQDGDYIVAGGTYSLGGQRVYLIKTNASGDTLWSRTWGGESYSVQQTQDGGYIIAGDINYHVLLIRTNASEDTLWTRTYGGSGNQSGASVQQTKDGGYIVAGWTTSFGNNEQFYLIKTDGQGSSGVDERSEGRGQMLEVSLQTIPNPFTTFASVPGHSTERFVLYDVSGRKVGMYKGDRIGVDLSAGVYFLKSEGQNAKPLRVVKVR